jgi:tRNA (adenine57-N1/adenine58-N1)-methyltransferase
MLLVHTSGKKLFYDVNKPQMNTKYGVILREEVNKHIGRIFTTDKGEEFLALEPSVCDIVENQTMAARPIYPYDSGIMCALLDVRKGKKVLEAGTGSGGMTTYMAYLGAEIITYERNEEFHRKAKQTLAGFKNVECRLGDVKGVKEGGFDAIFLDLQEPVEAITALQEKLKIGGFLGFYSPVMDEIRPASEAMRGQFFDIRGIILSTPELRIRKYVGLSGPMGFPGFFVWGRKKGGFRIRSNQEIRLEAKEKL